MQSAQAQVTASEIALNGVREEAKAGQRTPLDVLNAQQALVNARVALVTAQHDRVVASYSTLDKIGRLSPIVLNLPTVTYDPSVHYHQVRTAGLVFAPPTAADSPRLSARVWDDNVIRAMTNVTRPDDNVTRMRTIRREYVGCVVAITCCRDIPFLEAAGRFAPLFKSMGRVPGCLGGAEPRAMHRAGLIWGQVWLAR